jgi:putative phosphoesterase
MKVAALADIHGNYQALITVLDHVEDWNPDLVLVLGDTINRGPRSTECLHLIQKMEREKSWQVLRGNHEQYVLEFDEPNAPVTGPRFEMLRIIYWTYQKLSAEDIQAVKGQPFELDIPLPDLGKLKAVHASQGGIRTGIYPNHDKDHLLKIIDTEANLFLVGHTHQPLVREVDKTLVVNAGSIGLPFDGDNRTGYAQLTHNGKNWRAKIIRFEYDLEEARNDFFRTSFIPDGGPLAGLVLTELDLAWPQLSYWFKKYEKSILNGEINIQSAVDEFQKDPHRE